jgi:hypothetical protein
MISILLFFAIGVTIYPQNAMWDHYTIVPPLGTIESITTSDIEVFAASDRYLLFFNKLSYTFEKSVLFDCDLEIVGYDNYTNDLWIVCPDGMIRFNTISYTLRTYPAPALISRFALDVKNVYFESTKATGRFAMDKVTGALSSINSYPDDLRWYAKTSAQDIRKYPFLTPYYYYDDAQVSQVPFQQYPITAVYDDGGYLYVGTDHFGLLKYNKTSWVSQRLVYGPLDSQIMTVKKFNQRIYFLSASGISYFQQDVRDWEYMRLNRIATDISGANNETYLARDNRVLRTSGNLEFPVSDLKADVLTLTSDSQYLYIGTRSGLYRIILGTNSAIPFGPDRYAVYYVFPTKDAVYVGGEFALYRYSKAEGTWTTALNFGVKDIVGIADDIYALGTNNQIMRHAAAADSTTSDSSWTLLPYFNIYDIDTDDKVLYCATYAGIQYYEPGTALYTPVYNLPRIYYNYVFVSDNMLIAVSRNAIYILPLEYRD